MRVCVSVCLDKAFHENSVIRQHNQSFTIALNTHTIFWHTAMNPTLNTNVTLSSTQQPQLVSVWIEVFLYVQKHVNSSDFLFFLLFFFMVSLYKHWQMQN